MKKQRLIILGFTLIEVLMVTVIIGILAAIVLPVFARVRESGRRTQCLSNLRQIALAVQAYSQDNDDRFPFGGDPCDLNTDGWSATPYADAVSEMRPIQEVLAPYVHTQLVWKCPSDVGYTACSSLGANPLRLGANPTAFDKYGDSYEYNTYLTLLQSSTSSVDAVDNTGTVHGSTDIFLFSDTVGNWHGAGLLGAERYNVIFLDGHARNIDVDNAQKLFDLALIP